MTKLREEIKDITRSVMIPFHSQASTSAPNPSAFATKADLEAMGYQFFDNLNLLRSNFNEQGQKVAVDLKKTIATFRFKSDVEINALSLASEDVLQKITKHVHENLCRRRKRKEPVTCQTQAEQKRARHEDQDPDASGHGPHEGENLDKGKAIATEPLKKTKSLLTSEKLLKSSFDAIKRVKPEEEDWAFHLQPLSELPILEPLAKPSKDRVA
ncbi:hypothetical protein L6452_34840 [Arctium lappa]|uniref:Uncharacterized protein n=1 Tax=Arctium lappa TaxID=4217 RepID=A0ACB8YK14_ARCLA|nr:hypothetical protein L6452_34840 [Arctium lappa]